MRFPDLARRAEQLRGNPSLVAEERVRLGKDLHARVEQLRRLLTPASVLPLLLDLSELELQRVQAPTQMSPSNMAGQCRYLRGLAAAVPGVRFASLREASLSITEQALAITEELWTDLFFFQMLEGFRFDDSESETAKRTEAAQMSCLLAAMEVEIRYPEQTESRVLDLYAPDDDDVIRPAFGLSTRMILDAFRAILNKVEDRFNDRLPRVRAALKLSTAPRHSMGRNDVVHDAVKAAILIARRDFRESLLTGFNDLPPDWDPIHKRRFFDAFSFVPGTVNASLTTPMDSNEIAARPFLSFGNGEYLLLDTLYCRFAPAYRLPQAYLSDSLRSRLFKRRDSRLEGRTKNLLSSIVSPSRVLQSYYVRDPAVHGDVVEQDTLLICDDIAFVAESKAKPLRDPAATGGNVAKMLSDVKATIHSAYAQCVRVAQQVLSSDGLVIYDRFGKPIETIAAGSIHRVYAVITLGESYGRVATDLSPWIVSNPIVGYPWVVDEDTLETIASKMRGATSLADYILWRQGLHGLVSQSDEVVYAGFFLAHGAFKFPKYPDFIQLGDEYGDLFDVDYFRKHGMNVPDFKANKKPVFAKLDRRGAEVRFSVAGRAKGAIQVTPQEQRTPANRGGALPRRWKKRK